VNAAQEREFFGLAKVALGCRLRVMGGDMIGCETPKGDIRWSILGETDYAGEMGLLCAEVQGGRK